MTLKTQVLTKFAFIIRTSGVRYFLLYLGSELWWPEKRFTSREQRDPLEHKVRPESGVWQTPQPPRSKLHPGCRMDWPHERCNSDRRTIGHPRESDNGMFPFR